MLTPSLVLAYWMRGSIRRPPVSAPQRVAQGRRTPSARPCRGQPRSDACRSLPAASFRARRTAPRPAAPGCPGEIEGSCEPLASGDVVKPSQVLGLGPDPRAANDAAHFTQQARRCPPPERPVAGIAPTASSSPRLTASMIPCGRCPRLKTPPAARQSIQERLPSQSQTRAPSPRAPAQNPPPPPQTPTL